MNSQVVFLMVVMVSMALIQGAWSISLGEIVNGAKVAIESAANTIYSTVRGMNSQVIILMVVVVSMAFIQGAWSAPQNPLNDIIHAIQNAIANGKNLDYLCNWAGSNFSLQRFLDMFALTELMIGILQTSQKAVKMFECHVGQGAYKTRTNWSTSSCIRRQSDRQTTG
uniref:Uncharacterized protein n=1 Tax=Timema tahoe TaxID=61484 RepID=A0A7R9P0B3_9NEOP|nr:unnamed protein product [Timema tahoe]